MINSPRNQNIFEFDQELKDMKVFIRNGDIVLGERNGKYAVVRHDEPKYVFHGPYSIEELQQQYVCEYQPRTLIQCERLREGVDKDIFNVLVTKVDGFRQTVHRDLPTPVFVSLIISYLNGNNPGLNQVYQRGCIYRVFEHIQAVGSIDDILRLFKPRMTKDIYRHFQSLGGPRRDIVLGAFPRFIPKNRLMMVLELNIRRGCIRPALLCAQELVRRKVELCEFLSIVACDISPRTLMLQNQICGGDDNIMGMVAWMVVVKKSRIASHFSYAGKDLEASLDLPTIIDYVIENDPRCFPSIKKYIRTYGSKDIIAGLQEYISIDIAPIAEMFERTRKFKFIWMLVMNVMHHYEDIQPFRFRRIKELEEEPIRITLPNNKRSWYHVNNQDSLAFDQDKFDNYQKKRCSLLWLSHILPVEDTSDDNYAYYTDKYHNDE